jgi:hypothetical protein
LISRRIWPSIAKPLDPYDEHEFVRWVNQERNKSLVTLAEMQCSQGRGRVSGLAWMTLVLERIDNNGSVHELG